MVRSRWPRAAPGRQARLRDEPVPLAQQEVAHVQGDRHAVFVVEGQLAVAAVVAVLDVVVDQRGLVEALDGQGQGAGVFRERVLPVALEGAERADGQQRAPPFARPGEPVAGDALRFADRRAERVIERLGGKPGLDLAAEALHVEPSRPRVAAVQVNRLAYPVEVGRRVHAPIVEQRDGDAGDGGGFHQRVDALEGREATDADHGVDLAALQQRHDGGRPFGNQDDVAQGLGLGLEVGDGAPAAIGAQQAELVEGPLALAVVAQAFGQQEQAAVERDGRHPLAPGGVAQQHRDPLAELRVGGAP